MSKGPLTDQLIAHFDGLTGQLQVAARYLLDHPRDVALYSMREQARRAGVRPATMVRLAKALGFDGFEAVRELYAEAMRQGGLDFHQRANQQFRDQQRSGEPSLALEMVEQSTLQLGQLAQRECLESLVAAAETLSKCRRIYCLGRRSCFPVAWHFHYILSMVGEKSILLEAGGGTDFDPIQHATADDAILVISISPYTRATVELMQSATEKGMSAVVITDSEVAPVAHGARHTVVVGTNSPLFLHTLTPALCAAEMLAALVVGHEGGKALEKLKNAEAHFARMAVHLGTEADNS